MAKLHEQWIKLFSDMITVMNLHLLAEKSPLWWNTSSLLHQLVLQYLVKVNFPIVKGLTVRTHCQRLWPERQIAFWASEKRWMSMWRMSMSRRNRSTEHQKNVPEQQEKGPMCIRKMSQSKRKISSEHKKTSHKHKNKERILCTNKFMKAWLLHIYIQYVLYNCSSN